MTNTIMPMPPSHSVSDLQKMMETGKAEMPVTIFAPVVVKPEHDSNSASMIEGTAPEI